MTTLDESTTVTHRALESTEDDIARSGAQAWQLGILTDRAGRVHVGAIVAGTRAEPYSYIDLLVTGKQLADLRRLAERCIDDARLRRQLVQLVDLAAP